LNLRDLITSEVRAGVLNGEAPARH